MLPHYSALKVAETFRMLEALAPGRIDLGMGRAPGGDRLTASLLNPSNTFNSRDFVEQLLDLQNYLNDIPSLHSDRGPVRATPIVKTVPAQWLLSSSGESSKVAAELGMGFGFALFINPFGAAEAVNTYKQHFRPSANLSEPEALVAVFMFCSNDKEKNEQTRKVWLYRFLQLETRGRLDPVDYEDIRNYVFSPQELKRVDVIRQRFVIGKPEEVKKRLEQLAETCGVHEIMAVNAGIRFEDRLESYRLLAQAWGLLG